jgi:hypothetical protein
MVDRKVVSFDEFCYQLKLMHLFQKHPVYRVSQNSRILNSEHVREGPSGARKILRKKKFALLEEDISTLILFNT